MNDDMPWVLGLTDEEVQELRSKKQELTQYGKEKFRKLMNKEPTLDEMLEIAAQREKENQVLDIAKNLMEENKEAFQHLAAIERKELAEKDFEDLTRDQKIQLALEEIDWIVIGGQDGQEFYGSIQFLRKVLRSLR
jgi:NAD kinase